jgi:hypothetical protein
MSKIKPYFFKRAFIVFADKAKLVSLVIMLAIFPIISQASILEKAEKGGLTEIGDEVYGSADPTPVGDIVVNIITLFLGFLGLILVVMILLAGYKWMTAGGDEKKISEAKEQIKNAIFGLAIVLASWGITTWIFVKSSNITGLD